MERFVDREAELEHLTEPYFLWLLRDDMQWFDQLPGPAWIEELSSSNQSTARNVA